MVATVLTACQATQPDVIQRLDNRTLVTITYSRTPIPMASVAQPIDAIGSDFLQIGAIEVNRQGARRRYVWLEIWDLDHSRDADTLPEGYETILLIVDGAEMPLKIDSRSHSAIGTSEAVYNKYYKIASEAFYEITIEQIQQLAATTELKLRTTGRVVKEFVVESDSSISRDEFVAFMKYTLRNASGGEIGTERE